MCCLSAAQHLPCRCRCRGGGGLRLERCAAAAVTRWLYAVHTEWGTEAAGSSMSAPIEPEEAKNCDGAPGRFSERRIVQRESLGVGLERTNGPEEGVVV